jgi:hypothetical protein
VTGNGEVAKSPDQEAYAKDTKVELTAVPEAGNEFEKWVIGGTEFTENPIEVTMDENKTVEVVFKEIPDTPPSIILDWTEGNLMIVEAPCLEPENGLGFQYKVGNAGEAELASASWKIVDPDGDVVKNVEIDESKFYNSWQVAIAFTDLGTNPAGGKYTLTLMAEDIYGNTAEESLEFYVHVDEAIIGDYEFTSGIVEFEGANIVPIGTEAATLEATITLDSKVRVRIYAFKNGEAFNCEDEDNILVYDEVIERDASSTEKEVFELDLTGVEGDEGYNALQLILYNPLCGTMPCNYCPDDEKMIPLKFDTEVTLECLPCSCLNPCDPCWPGFFNPGLQIDGLLYNDALFYDVTMELDGKEATELTYTGDVEVRAKITEEYFPGLEGNYDFDWTVTTFTGQEVTETCNATIDFVDPTIDIGLDCLPCGEATKLVNFTFTDGVGLDDTKVWFDNIKSVTFSKTPDGETEKSFENPGSTEFNFDPEGATIFTVDATIVADIEGEELLEGTEYGVNAWAEDTSCNENTEEATCVIDTTPPNVHFGLDCEYYPNCELLCIADNVHLSWLIEDGNFDYAEIEVSHGEIVPSTVTTPEGTALWTFEGVECGSIVATMTAVDECGNETVKTFTADIDNVPPEINEFNADACFDLLECDSTNTTLSWDVSGECSPTVHLLVLPGRLYLDGELVYDNNIEDTLEFTASGFDSQSIIDSYYSTSTLAGDIEWRFGPEDNELDCTYLFALLIVEDDCGNYSYEVIESGTKVDHKDPELELNIDTVPWTDNDDVGTFVDSPGCDASCLYLNWVVDEDCLEGLPELVANYPQVTCDTDVPAVEGEYDIDLGEIHQFVRQSFFVKIDDDYIYTYEGTLTWGSKKVCLPLIDCDEYVATLTAYDICDNVASTTAFLGHYIDRKRPELTFDLSTDTDLTGCATEATMTFTMYDESYPCEGCGEGGCQIGYCTWELEKDGASGEITIYSNGEQPVFTGSSTPTISATVVGSEDYIYEGYFYVDLSGYDCDTFIATFTAWDCCCPPPNLSEPQRLEIDFDDKAPVIEYFEFAQDASGTRYPEGIIDTAETTACGSDSIYLTWSATDGCLEPVEKDDFVLTQGYVDIITSTDATGVAEWFFGETAGATLTAKLVVSDGCNTTEATPIEVYVANTEPGLYSDTSFRFDAQSDTVVIRFDTEVESAGATAIIWFRNNEDDDWLKMATYAGSDTSTNAGIVPGETGDDYVQINVPDYEKKNIGTEPVIVLGTYYKVDLFNICTPDTICEGVCADYITFDGVGTALSPEF